MSRWIFLQMKHFHCGNFRQHQGIVSSSLKCDPLKRCHGENRSHPSGVFEQNVPLGLKSRLIKRVFLFRWLDGSGAEAPPHLMVWTCSRADKHCVTGILLACWSFGVGVNVYTATNTKPINGLVDFDGVFLVPSQRLLGILFYWQCCISGSCFVILELY